MRWVLTVARMVETRNTYPILVVRPERIRWLRTLKRIWGNNIKIDHKLNMRL